MFSVMCGLDDETLYLALVYAEECIYLERPSGLMVDDRNFFVMISIALMSLQWHSSFVHGNLCDVVVRSE